MLRDYNDPQYKALRSRVRRRDKYRCSWPGCSSKRIQVHHILPWSKYPNLRYVDSNCICLCRDHHKQVTKSEEAYCSLLTTIVQQTIANASIKKTRKKRG